MIIISRRLLIENNWQIESNIMRHFILALCLLGIATAHAQAQIAIEDLHLRYGIGDRPSVIYATFTNHSHQPISLVGVSSPSFGRIELHNHLHEGNIMRMRKIERITLPPHKAIKLQTGGLHLMAFDRSEADAITLTFTFDNAPPQTLRVEKTDKIGKKHKSPHHH